ncbi:hypothetical protein BC831DRAFT_464558 [Entophlyctis helioformis]|nr:hypothetical protein BC831DRAFT_464558 [Entophlyctis helioformis]
MISRAARLAGCARSSLSLSLSVRPLQALPRTQTPLTSLARTLQSPLAASAATARRFMSSKPPATTATTTTATTATKTFSAKLPAKYGLLQQTLDELQAAPPAKRMPGHAESVDLLSRALGTLNQDIAAAGGADVWAGPSAATKSWFMANLGPLATYVYLLHNVKDTLSPSEILDIWIDTLQRRWAGDLAQLPDIRFGTGEHDLAVSIITDRETYRRVCERLGYDTAARAQDAQTEALFNDYTAAYTAHAASIHPLRFVPLLNGWTDLVDVTHPVAVGWHALVYGLPHLLAHLAQTGLVDLARYNTIDGSFKVLDLVALCGHLPVLQQLHEAGNHAATVHAMDMAAMGGHLAVLQWLHANRTEGCTTAAMDYAAEYGHLDVLKWLHETGQSCTLDAMDMAMQNGHQHVVQWIKDTPSIRIV